MKISPNLHVPLRNLVLFASITACFVSCKKAETASEGNQADADERSQVVRIITWEDYLAPEVIESFEAETGLRVEVDAFDNTEDLIGTLRAYSNKYDVVIFDSSSVNRFADMKLLRPLEKTKLDRMSNLDPKFLDQGSDPGNKFSIPYLWGSTLVAYRTDKITDPEPSFELLFDKKLDGHVFMLDDMFESFAMAHLMEGRSINDTSKAGLESASEKLRQQVRDVSVRYGTDAEVREALGSGECWAALCYSGDAAWVAEDHPEVSYFFPKEGAALWIDVMSISRDAANIDGAHRFINHLLQPEVIAANSNSLWYANPNKHAEVMLSEDLVADEALFPPKELIEQCEFFSVTSPEHHAQISRLSSAIRAEALKFSRQASVPAAEK